MLGAIDPEFLENRIDPSCPIGRVDQLEYQIRIRIRMFGAIDGSSFLLNLFGCVLNGGLVCGGRVLFRACDTFLHAKLLYRSYTGKLCYYRNGVI